MYIKQFIASHTTLCFNIFYISHKNFVRLSSELQRYNFFNTKNKMQKKSCFFFIFFLFEAKNTRKNAMFYSVKIMIFHKLKIKIVIFCHFIAVCIFYHSFYTKCKTTKEGYFLFKISMPKNLSFFCTHAVISSKICEKGW